MLPPVVPLGWFVLLRTARRPSYYKSSGSCCAQATMSALSIRINLACGATCQDASHILWNILCQADFRSWCKVSWFPFDYSQYQCPAEHNVRSIRELSALKPSSTPTCSRTHHHPQQPPSYPKGEGRWSRRVVSRSSPELKSGASRPSLSIRYTGKNGRKNPSYERKVDNTLSDVW